MELGGLIPNTTFYLYWNSNELNRGIPQNGNQQSLGELVFRTNISF